LASHDDELLKTARRLLARTSGQRGRLSSATVRRSVSTAYYALFHFLVDEAGRFLIGSEHKYRQRRRVLARTFTHGGIKIALDKVRGAFVDQSIEELLRPPGTRGGSVESPPFARAMAATFVDAQSRRHDADYDLNKEPSTGDAQILADKVQVAISSWVERPSSDDDFKHALCLLMLLKGQLKREN
jgi:uncharacterized protein (UPF0332 family)